MSFSAFPIPWLVVFPRRHFLLSVFEASSDLNGKRSLSRLSALLSLSCCHNTLSCAYSESCWAACSVSPLEFCAHRNCKCYVQMVKQRMGANFQQLRSWGDGQEKDVRFHCLPSFLTLPWSLSIKWFDPPCKKRMVATRYAHVCSAHMHTPAFHWASPVKHKQNYSESQIKNFFKEEMQMANRHMKRCSTLLIIRECKSKPQWDITPHLSEWPSKSTNSKCWWGCGEKGTLVHCWWECKLVQPLWRTVWRVLKKLKIELLYDLAIPLLCVCVCVCVCMYIYIYLKETKTLIWKDTCSPMFIAASFTIVKI